MRIRKRMVSDIVRGAILPPIVLGVVLDKDSFDLITTEVTHEQFENLLVSTEKDQIAIIDGMQRTTAFFEADVDAIGDHSVRIEIWASENINSLIYRMLVLNTGQVPWNLRRQIEVVFTSMIKEINEKVKEISIITIDDKRRRKTPGEFQANDIVELYLTFGARKEVVDTKDRLADEFVRLDFIGATEATSITLIFYECLNFLATIDKQFGRHNTPGEDGRFVDGIDLFKSQPARVGFITALAKRIMGRPGNDRGEEEQNITWEQLKTELTEFTTRLSELSDQEIGIFLAYDSLNENIARKSSRVGQFEREFFTKAFETLIEERFDVTDLQVCWRAY